MSHHPTRQRTDDPADNTYTRNGEWSGFSVRPVKTGWLCEYWSRIQGTRSGEQTLVAYSADAPRGADLETPWNEWMAMGDAVAECITGGAVRCRRRGHEVR